MGWLSSITRGCAYLMGMLRSIMQVAEARRRSKEEYDYQECHECHSLREVVGSNEEVFALRCGRWDGRKEFTLAVFPSPPQLLVPKDPPIFSSTTLLTNHQDISFVSVFLTSFPSILITAYTTNLSAGTSFSFNSDLAYRAELLRIRTPEVASVFESRLKAFKIKHVWSTNLIFVTWPEHHAAGLKVKAFLLHINDTDDAYSAL